MLILTIRHAETALKDGRLDEAFDLVRRPEVREHARGQALINDLVGALAARGREHLAAGRAERAVEDCRKAEELGGNLPEVAALRGAVTEQARTTREQADRQARLMAAARRAIDEGQLSVGQEYLEKADARGEPLRQQVAVRRVEAEAAIERAEEALERADQIAAVQAICAARQAHAGHGRLDLLEARALGGLLERTRAAIAEGRLDRATFFMNAAEPLAEGSMLFVDARRGLDLLAKAAAVVGEGRPRRAAELLAQAKAALPEAVWIDIALADARTAADCQERLHCGPLGAMMAGSSAGRKAEVAKTIRLPEPALAKLPVVSPPKAPGPARLDRFMLHVDGVGSYLVLRSDQVTLGPGGSSRGHDVPLLADSSVGSVSIERVEDDYFVTSPSPVMVNNAPVTRHLLAEGDRIALSDRCRVRFSRPNAASTSAVLSVSGTRLPGSDARRVLLMGDSLVVGPGVNAHIRADALDKAAVLYCQAGRLFCRGSNEVTVDGRPLDRNAGLAVGAKVAIGPVSMVIKEA